MQNRKLAEFLTIAHKQRTRQRGVFADQFGADNPAIGAMDAELAEIELFINRLKTFGSVEARVTEPDATAPEPKK